MGETVQVLLSDLKSLWKVQDNTEDKTALALIERYITKHNLVHSKVAPPEVVAEDFSIQTKVLAKTRLKTDALLKKLEDLESLLASDPQKEAHQPSTAQSKEITEGLSD